MKNRLKHLLLNIFSLAIVTSAVAQIEIDCEPDSKEHAGSKPLSATLDPVSAEDDTTFTKNVCVASDKRYEMVLTDSLGNVRCKGYSQDEEGSIKHGMFIFYYPNGNIESKGQFANNVKIGEWKRWDIDGKEKQSKFYSISRKEKLESLEE